MTHDKTIEELIEAGMNAPHMKGIEAAQLDATMKKNISITEKGRELGTVEHLSASIKLSQIGDKSKHFYETAHNAREAIKAQHQELIKLREEKRVLREALDIMHQYNGQTPREAIQQALEKTGENE